MIDFTERMRQGRQAALSIAAWGIVLSLFISVAVGLFFAEESEPLLRRAHWLVAAFGFFITLFIVLRILTHDIASHHYRENLRAEKDAERVEAEIAELNARASLYAAKERAIFTPLPNRIAAPPLTLKRDEPAIYHNGKRIESGSSISGPPDIDETAYDEPPPLEAPAIAREIEHAEPLREPAPGVSSRGQIVITESAAAYDLRIHRLAREIYDLCRDVNPPTQAAIMERIPRTAGGLLRSNDDITRALNILAARGLIEAEKGSGITRLWLDDRGAPLPQSPRRNRVTVNVPLSRA